MPNPGQVWSYIGGWLYQAYLKEIEDNVPEQLRNYYNSCALRMSIALSSFGKDLKNEAGAELIGDKANADALGVKPTLSPVQGTWPLMCKSSWATPTMPTARIQAIAARSRATLLCLPERAT